MKTKQGIKQKILDKIKNKTFKPKKAQQALGVSEKTIYKHLRNLTKQGLITKKGRGQYEIKEGGEVLMDTRESPLKRGYRLHGLMVYFGVPFEYDLARWAGNRGRFLTSRGLAYEKSFLRNKAGVTDTLYFFVVDDVYRAFATKKGVMVYLPQIEREALESVYEALADSILLVGEKLNHLFGGLFYKNNRIWQVSVRRAELAHVDNGIARQHAFEKDKLKIFLDGEERLRLDVSLGLPEVEFPSVQWQEQDARVVIENWYKDLIRAGASLMPPTRMQAEIYASGENFRVMNNSLNDLGGAIVSLTKIVLQHIQQEGKD